MIGAHELLLIIRGQNQASAALGRVSNDLRRLQAMRNLRAQQTTLINRAAAQALSIQQVESSLGTKNLAIQKAQLSVQNQEAHVRDRILGLDQRMIAIDRGRANLDARRLNMENRLAEFAGRRLKIESDILKVEQREAQLATRLSAMGPGGVQRGQLALRRFNLGTQEIQRQLALQQTTGRVTRLQGTEGATEGEIAQAKIRQIIAQRQLQATRMSTALLGRQYGLLKKQTADAALAQKDLSIQYRQASANARALANREEELRVAIKNLEFGYQSLDARERQVLRAGDQMQRQLTVLSKEYQIVASRAMEAAAGAASMRTQLELTNLQLKNTNELIAAQRWEKFATGARAVDHLGRVMQLFGLVATAAFAMSAKQAADFNTQAQLAATQFRRPGQGQAVTAQLGQQIQNVVLKQMNQFPASAQEMEDALYQIFSGTNVKSIGDAGKLLTTFNQMAVAGGADLKTMVEAGISIRNNFPRDFKNMGDAANYFASAVRYGRMTYEQFGAALPTVAATAKTVGLGFRDIANDLAFLTRQTGGARTAQDATGLARLYQLLIRPDFVAGFQKLGVNVLDSAGKMRPLVKIVDDLIKRQPGLTRTPAQIANLFKTVSAAGGDSRGTQGTIQARRTFDLMVQSATTYDDIVHKVSTTQQQFNKDYTALSKSPGVQWRVFTNQLKALILIIGQGAIPALLEVFRPLARFAQYLEGLSPHTKRLIGYIGLMVSALTLLGGTALVIVGGFASIIIGIRSLAIWMSRGRASAGLLAEETGTVNIRMLALRGGLLGVIIILTPLIGRVIGLKNAIELVSIALAAWKISRWAFGLNMLASSAVGAEGPLLALRATLLTLAGMGVITIVVEAIIHRKQLDRFFTGLLGKVPLIGDTLASRNDISKQLQGKTEQQLEAYVAELKKQGAPGFVVNAVTKYLNQKFPVAKAPATINQMNSEAMVKARAAILAQYKRAHPHLDPNTGQPFATIFTNQDVVKAVANIERLRKIAEKAPTYKNYAAYEKALTALQANASKEQMAIANDLLSTQETATKKAHNKQLANQKKHNEAMRQQAQQNYKTMVSTLQQTFQTIQQANQSQLGTLFSGPFVNSARTQNNLQWGGKLSGRDLLHDLRSQVSQFRQFRSVLDRLAKRGMPFELLDQIRQMGPEALPEARALLTLNQRDFASYTRVFRRGQNLVDQATRVDMTRQLRHWRSFGRSIARQILLGLRDEKSPTEAYFAGMLRSLGVLPRVTGPGGKNEKYVSYVYHGGTMDYSTWLRKSKLHHKNR